MASSNSVSNLSAAIQRAQARQRNSSSDQIASMGSSTPSSSSDLNTGNNHIDRLAQPPPPAVPAILPQTLVSSPTAQHSIPSSLLSPPSLPDTRTRDASERTNNEVPIIWGHSVVLPSSSAHTSWAPTDRQIPPPPPAPPSRHSSMARQDAYNMLSGRIDHREAGSTLSIDTMRATGVFTPQYPLGPSPSLAPTSAIEDLHLDSALSSPASPTTPTLAPTQHLLARPEHNPSVEVNPSRSTVQGTIPAIHRSTPTAAHYDLESGGTVDTTVNAAADAEQEMAEMGYPYTESFGQRLSNHYDPFPLLPLSDSIQTVVGPQSRRAGPHLKRMSTLPGYEPLLIANDALGTSNENSQTHQQEHAERTLKGLPEPPKPAATQPITPHQSHPAAMSASQPQSAILTLENPITTAPQSTPTTQTTASIGSISSLTALNSTPMAMTPRTRVSYGVLDTNPSQPSPLGPNALHKRYDTMDSGTSTPSDPKGYVRSSLRHYRNSTATLVDSHRMSLASLLQPSQPSNSFLSNQRTSMATLVAPTNHKRTYSDNEGKSANMPPLTGSGTGPPSGPPGKPPLEFGSHKLFDPKLRPLFQPIFRGYVPFIAILSIIVVWGIVPIFWGSLYKLTSRRIVGYIINGDQPGYQIGQTFQDAILGSVNQSNPQRLHWQTRPRSMFPTDESITRALKTDQDAWVIVQIMDNATNALVEAQATGDPEWNASQVLTIWYATARNYQAVPGSIVGPTRGLLVSSMNALNVNITATWAEQVASGDTSQVQEQLALALRAPQTVGHAVDFTTKDVNPWDMTIATATTFVGLIFLTLLAFNITMALFGARQPIMPFLRFKHLLLFRLCIPLATNLLVAFLFSLINLAFHVQFRKFGAGGFFAFVALMFTGIMVLELMVELALELLGPKFVAFGLMFIIILNISGAGYPIPMLNTFYRISYAMPFYNLRQAFLVLLFSQGKGMDILISWAILVAWLVVLLTIFPLLVRREQKKAIGMRKAARAGAGPGAAAGAPGPPGPPGAPVETHEDSPPSRSPPGSPKSPAALTLMVSSPSYPAHEGQRILPSPTTPINKGLGVRHEA